MRRSLALPLYGRTSILILLIAISALVAAAGLALAPDGVGEGRALRKPITGALFVCICLLGMVAVLRPASCSAVIGLRPRARPIFDGEGAKVEARGFQGHHPDCERFSSHVLNIAGRTLCAGCTGLFIGGLLALLLASAYYFGGIGFYGGALPLAAGVAGVSIGLTELAVTVPLPWMRMVSNACLAVGSFLILAAVDGASHALYANLLVLGIVLYWIMSKIILSRLHHRRLCSLCPDLLCELRPDDVSG